MALRRRCPGLCDAVVYHGLGLHACALATSSSGDLGARRPKGELRAWDRRAICCLTYARNADAALLSHAHIISKAPHYCTTKAPHR